MTTRFFQMFGTDFVMTDKLYLFLRELGVLDIFLLNARHEGEVGSEAHPLNAIGSHFMWPDTPQGSEFWSDIYHKFLDDEKAKPLSPERFKEVI